jgi:hypothetical protein
MQRFRPLAALAVATALVGLSVTPAFAGTPGDVRSDIDCDTSTGEYVVTYTVRVGFGPQVILSAGYELVLDGSLVDDGDLEFDPTTLQNNESATAELRLPGTSQGDLTGFVSLEQEGVVDTDDVLDGTCVAVDPDPTPTTSPAPTTTLPAEPASTASAVPTYTG